MKDLHNIERSRFTHGAYIGYAAGTVWTITASSSSYGRWLAIPRQADAPAAVRDMRLYAHRLSDLSAKLAALN